MYSEILHFSRRVKGKATTYNIKTIRTTMKQLKPRDAQSNKNNNPPQTVIEVTGDVFEGGSRASAEDPRLRCGSDFCH